MGLTQPHIAFERYADDIVIHTRSLEQSNFILDKLKLRMLGFGLELHPEKTRIVYCFRTARMHKESKHIPCSFDFLGFTFKARQCKKANGETFWGFRPAISKKSVNRILSTLRRLKIHRWVTLNIHQVASQLIAKTRGWIYCYGKFRKSELWWLFRKLNYHIMKWARNKFKLRTYSKSNSWLKRTTKHYSNTFVHWSNGFVG
jgi:RNA-directed DNA polymerase